MSNTEYLNKMLDQIQRVCDSLERVSELLDSTRAKSDAVKKNIITSGRLLLKSVTDLNEQLSSEIKNHPNDSYSKF